MEPNRRRRLKAILQVRTLAPTLIGFIFLAIASTVLLISSYKNWIKSADDYLQEQEWEHCKVLAEARGEAIGTLLNGVSKM